MSKFKIIFLTFLATLSLGVANYKSESYFRNRTLKLFSDHGSCSGEQVKAPSGQNYILTAAHCLILKDDNNSINVQTADGRVLSRKIIAEDAKSDLLLLEGLPGIDGLNIALSQSQGDSVRTFTHGFGFETYKTEGSIVDFHEALVEMGDEACLSGMPKYRTIEIEIFGFKIPVCIMDTLDSVTTAMIVPGSSGGMVVNSWGNLVGVVSAGDGNFGYLVSLKDIHAFVDNY